MQNAKAATDIGCLWQFFEFNFWVLLNCYLLTQLAVQDFLLFSSVKVTSVLISIAL